MNVEDFITENRKVCWDSDLENDEYCIGENKVREFLKKASSELSNTKVLR